MPTGLLNANPGPRPHGGAAEVRLSRVVTCFRQWSNVAHWVGWDALFAAGIEWVLVNDCPAEPCPAALEAVLAARGVRVVTVAENLGRCGARNLGVELARGGWVEHVDGDDLPLPLEVAGLPPPDAAEVLQFPAPVVTRAATTIADPAEFADAAPAQADTWAPLLPRLRPFDVRLTATMWNRAFYRQLGGYDGRFEGMEDVQLALKADQAAARAMRRLRAKQVYCRRPGRETLGRTRLAGAERLLRWVRAMHPEIAPKVVEGWLAKEVGYLTLLHGWETLRHPRRWWHYARWRLMS